MSVNRAQELFREFMAKFGPVLKDSSGRDLAVAFHQGIEAGIQMSHEQRLASIEAKYGPVDAALARADLNVGTPERRSA